MSTTTPQQPTPAPATISPFHRWLLNNRTLLRNAIFVLAAALIIIPVAMMIRIGVGFGFWWILAAGVGAVSAAIGAIDLVRSGDDEQTALARLRLELMLLGGTIGLALTILGFALPFLTFREILGSGLDSWRENPRALIWPGLSLIGGLAVMFASVQLARGMERESQALRRVIYGYNVALTSLLVIAVLALPNVLAYAEPFTKFFGRPFDWTATDVNSISPLMRNYLADIKEPVKVYVMLPRNNPIAMDTQTLLENCRSLNSKITWEPVSPRDPGQGTRISGLMEKYNISDPLGLLVVVGTETEKTKPDFAFIKYRDLFQEDAGTGRRGGGLSYAFSGENALYNALASLTEGKVVIYFTSGHGELTPEGGMPPGMPPGMPRPKAGGLGKLRDRLTERKSVEVRSLKLDRSVKKVPDDASVVVVARPTTAFNPDEVKVLREYLQRNARMDKVKDSAGREREEEKVTAGKLMLLFDPVLQREGGSPTMAPTGLESLLAEYNVKLGNDRILTVDPRVPNPTQVVAIPDPESANPVSKAFSPSPTTVTLFFFQNARTVEPVEAKGPGRSVDKVMIVPLQFDPIVDSKLNADPASLVEALRADDARLQKMTPAKSPTIAVGVSDGGTPPGMPRDAAHGAMLKDTPRMVVFGSANWIADEGLEGGRGTLRVDLFNSCVSWLREKSSIGAKIEAKKRKEYEPNLTAQDTGKVMYLPLGLLLLGVIGLGTGVWVVRRR